LNLKLDSRLKEMNFGEWEGRRWDDIVDSNLQSWMDDYLNVRTTKGESWQDLKLRVNEFLTEIVLCDVRSTRIIVTHAGVIRTINHLLTGESMDAEFSKPVPFATALGLTI